MAENSSNSSETGSQSTGSQTTSNSTKNFSGGLPGLGGQSWGSYSGSPSSETEAANASGVQGPGLKNGDFGSPWSGNGNSGSGSGDYTYNNTPYSNNKPEPVMTVDEVYGKTETETATGISGNQPVVESLGDYAASSNEKSGVETSTFGKQDNITVTPESVTENKGLVDNTAIDSIEGLNFQQKDKESQEVMEAKKSRDEAEAEDKSNQMRDSLKAKTDLTADEDAVNQFQIGESDAEKAFNEQDLSNQQILNEAKVNLDNYEESLELSKAQLERDSNKLQKYKEQAKQIQQDKDYVTKAIDYIENGTDNGSPLAYDDDDPTYNDLLSKYDVNKSETTVETLEAINAAIDEQSKRSQETISTRSKQIEADQKNYEYEVKMYNKMKSDYEESLQSYNMWKQESNKKVAQGEMPVQWTQKVSKDVEAIEAEKNYEYVKDYNEMSKESVQRIIINAVETLKTAETGSKEYNQAIAELQNINQDYIGLFKGDPFAYKNPGKMLETITNHVDSQTERWKAAYDAIAKSENATPEQKVQAEKVITNLEKSNQDLEQAASKLSNNIENASPDDIEAYITAQKQYTDNLKAALEIGNAFTQTDFNKDFVAAVAKANDFTVTLADGTKTTYSQFATEMATKSPAIAKAMYEAKAQKYEAENHPVLAKIERAKAEMVTTWLGSKLTQADNKVRDQFNQMSKTNMRATYAAYSNVLNDPNASPEAKAEASAAIEQANALMTASAALQASTGFFSVIGDGMGDGDYGVTDPESLNAYQKTLNAIYNFTKITLGLGVTPGANKAYQNMYYMAGAKVNESGLFSKDFDSDGFALCQEYGNNAAAGMIAGAGELATGIALFFNPAMSGMGLNLVIDSIQTFTNGLYGVQKDARKAEKYTQEVLSYFKEAESIASETGNKEALDAISNGITQIENFELKADEVGNLNNWLEGSGSNTATNEKFNQSLSYDEWLKLIEADPTMQEYAKKLIAEKKEK